MVTTRRVLSAAILGGLAGGMAAHRAAWAQPTGTGQQEPPSAGRPPARGEGLPDRGAPRGRIGAATRGEQGGAGALALDLVAPLRGVGLTSTDQPALFYLLSDGTTWPMRLAISTRNQPRPLADIELPRPQPAGLGVVRLREHGVRLVPDVIHVWSVAVLLDPRAPSRDLVASATIQYRPTDPALEQAVRQAPPNHRVAALAEAGYWYDAVALAEEARSTDGGAALAGLLAGAELPMPGAGAPRRGATR
jgi:hypothetical protein